MACPLPGHHALRVPVLQGMTPPMTFTVSVRQRHRFPCEPNETVLDAAQRAGYELPYSCRKGVCGSCKGQIVSGEVRAFAGDALSAAEQAERNFLYCQTRPRSDLEIVPKMIEKADPFARKKLAARVFRMKRLADDVMLVHLRYPAGERVRFKAGQYVSILWTDGRNRDFSMANPPSESDGIQLHVRLVQDGAFTTHVFEKMKVGDHLDVEVPHGSFALRESDKPILFVAGGTGFAPMQVDHRGHGGQGHPARHDAVLGRAAGVRALLRPAARNGRRRTRASATSR